MPDPGGPDDDPLRQLEDWGRQVERRMGRAHAGRRLWTALTAPPRGIRRWVRRRPGATVAIVLVVAVGASCWLGRATVVDLAGLNGHRPYPTQSHPFGDFATSTATAAPAGPFAGTPAARWAEGEAGITMPPATAVDGFTAEAVATSLASVKAAMVAARLDRVMLENHDPSAFLKLLAPAEREVFGKRFREERLLSLVTVLADGLLLGRATTRVSGRTSFASVRDSGKLRALEVVTNYVWAYAFEDEQVVVAHDEVRWRFYRAGDVAQADLGLRPYNYDAYFFNMDCGALGKGRLSPPRALSRPGDGDASPENEANFFDPDHALDVGDSCGTALGTPTA